MIVAEIILTNSVGPTAGFVHRVYYDNIETAKKVFHEIADLLRRREKRKNDLPELLELEGISKLSIPFASVNSVGLTDYVKQNKELEEIREAFPNMKWD